MIKSIFTHIHQLDKIYTYNIITTEFEFNNNSEHFCFVIIL